MYLKHFRSACYLWCCKHAEKQENHIFHCIQGEKFKITAIGNLVYKLCENVVKCSVINFALQYPICSNSKTVLKKRKIKLDGDFWLHSDFSTFFWKECESTCESSPHLIDSCMSKTQTQKTAIYKLMQYLWSKVSREDSSAQQGGVSRDFVKLCESGIRSGTQNFAEGLFLWAPAASAHGLFFPSVLLPLLSGARSKCELSVSRAQHGTPRVLPCLSPAQDSPYTNTPCKNKAPATAESWGNSPLLLASFGHPICAQHQYMSDTVFTAHRIYPVTLNWTYLNESLVFLLSALMKRLVPVKKFRYWFMRYSSAEM